jgi:hypothetical protein
MLLLLLLHDLHLHQLHHRCNCRDQRGQLLPHVCHL